MMKQDTQIAGATPEETPKRLVVRGTAKWLTWVIGRKDLTLSSAGKRPLVDFPNYTRHTCGRIAHLVGLPRETRRRLGRTYANRK